MSYNHKQSLLSSFVFAFILCSPLFVFLGMGIYNEVIYNIHCGGYLKRAADANTIDIAKKELSQAMKYLEDNKMTEGDTSVFYKTPSTDVDFWYNNLKSSKEELEKVTPQTTQLERVNILMKLRETLLDHTKDGDSVTSPDYISLFPNNQRFFMFGSWSVIIACFGMWYFVMKVVYQL